MIASVLPFAHPPCWRPSTFLKTERVPSLLPYGVHGDQHGNAKDGILFACYVSYGMTGDGDILKTWPYMRHRSKTPKKMCGPEIRHLRSGSQWSFYAEIQIDLWSESGTNLSLYWIMVNLMKKASYFCYQKTPAFVNWWKLKLQRIYFANSHIKNEKNWVSSKRVKIG